MGFAILVIIHEALHILVAKIFRLVPDRWFRPFLMPLFLVQLWAFRKIGVYRKLEGEVPLVIKRGTRAKLK